MRLLRPFDEPVQALVTQCPIPEGSDLSAEACVVETLRGDLASRLRSPANAPGSLVLLGGAQNMADCAKFAGISGPLTTASVVQAVARDMHAAFDASGLPAALATFAKSLGPALASMYCIVLYFEPKGPTPICLL